MIAACLAALLIALALLHLYWGFGGARYRRFATPVIDGKPTIEPSGVLFATVAAGLCLAALVAVSIASGQSLHGAGTAWAWILAALFGFRAVGDFRLIGFFCRHVDLDHQRVERGTVVPVCLFLSLGFVRLALSQPG